jgi:hypothetical protein
MGTDSALPSRDPASIVVGWAWTEPPAAVSGVPSGAIEGTEVAAAVEGQGASLGPVQEVGATSEDEPEPLGLGRIAESLSLNLVALDAAIEHCLGGVEEAGGLMDELAAVSRPAGWILATAGGIAVGIVARRVSRRRRRWATEATREEALNPWVLGPVTEPA